MAASNAGKLLAGMQRNPRYWRIEDLKTVAGGKGIEHDQHGTSHVVFRHPVAGRLSVPAQPVYIRMFVDFVGRAGEQHED